MRNTASTSTYNGSFGLQAGLASSIPVVIWGLLQTHLYPAPNAWAVTLAEMIQTVWILQAVAIALVLPWYAWRYDWRQNLLQSATLIAIPLPVYSIGLLSAALPYAALLYALGFLILLTVVLLAAIKLFDSVIHNVQFKALIRTTLQLAGALLIWTYRDLWLAALIN